MSYTIPQIPVTASSILGDDFLEIGGGTGGSRKLLASTFVLATDPRLDALGTVTSVSASGGLTGFGFTGSPITTDGTLTLTGTLVPTAGGTGLTIFATGDLIQASNSTTLSRLAAVAAGNVLLSGGPGTVSSWGKVGIGTHVSGLGSNVAAALATNTGTAGAFVLFNGALGQPNSGNASNLTALNASELTSGTVPDARFPATLPAISGANLTALNATQLASGTVPDARFPATLPAISGANLTALNASNLGSGTVPDARFPATLPAISGVNLTGTASGLTAGTVTTIPNLSGDVTSAGNTTSIASGVIVNDDINASAAIADTKLATISTTGKVLNTATTATSANTANAIVSRDSNGDFIARIVNGTSGVFTALSAVNSVRVTSNASIDGPSSALDYIGGQARVWSWGPNSGTVGTFAVRLANSNGLTASEPLTVTSTSTTVSGALYSGNGSAWLPSLSFSNDQTTGLYRIGSNNIGVTTGGATVLNISTAGMTVAGTLTANTLLAGIPTFAPTANGAIQLASHTTSAGGIGFGTLLSLHQETDQVLVFRNSSTSWGTFIEATNPGTGQSSAFRMTNTGSSGRSVDIGTGGSTHPVTAVRSRWYLYDTTGSTLIATAQGASSTAGDFKIDLTTASTSTTTGALQVAGGVGVAGALHVGGQITGNVTGNVSGTSGSTTGNAANVTGTVAIGNGGTGAITASAALAALGGQPLDAALTALAGGSDFVKFAGPTSSIKTFTLPNVDSTILTSSAAVTVGQGGTGLTALGTAGQVLRVNTGATGLEYATAGSGTVESVSVVSANGVSGTVATATTTPAITLALGDISAATSKPSGVSIPATSIVSGRTYTILTVGNTNFTLIGAASNTVGVVFVATAVGTGTGTVTSPIARTFAARAGDVFNVKDYGATGDGSTNDLPAFNAAATAMLAYGGGCIYMPAPAVSYKLAGVWTITQTTNSQSICLRGDGPGVTKLFFSSASNGVEIIASVAQTEGATTSNVVTVEDFSICSSQDGIYKGLKISGLNVNGSSIGYEIRRISFEGYTVTKYWKDAIHLINCPNAVIKSIRTVSRNNSVANGGDAILLDSTAPIVDRSPTVCDISNVNVQGHAYGIRVIGSNTWEGVTVSESTFVLVNTGIYWNTTTVEEQLNVTNCHMKALASWVNVSNCNRCFITSGNFHKDGSASFTGIDINANSDWATITNNFLRCGAADVAISMDSDNHTITGNKIEGPSVGIVLNSGSDRSLVVLNQLYNAGGTARAGTCVQDNGADNIVEYSGSTVWDPGSLVSGQQDVTTFTVTGVKFGSTVSLGVPYDLDGLTATASVFATNVIRITLYNSTGGTINLPSGTWRVRATTPGP